MASILVEEHEGVKKAYESTLVQPRGLATLNHPLALRIVQELVQQPGCPLDIARSLKEHEQKVYYHVRKLEQAGIIVPVRQEKRFGMVAKVYGLVSPVVAVKLHDDPVAIPGNSPVQKFRASKFFHPFVDQGKLTAKVILGYPYPHGEFDTASSDGAHTFDLGLLLGGMLREADFSRYLFDVDAKQEDLQHHLILVGNAKTNTIIHRLNGSLPVQFDVANEQIKSARTGKIYKDPWMGVIIKVDNPFEKGKQVLVVGGMRTRGVHAAIIGLTQHLDMLTASYQGGPFACVVEGLDRDGDKIIDHIKVME
ncbi:MAG: helix-turn-helix transcriptional regulator [Candidatus Aenigmarchaeota archaeon]|nr:helix-turn-helix transcriptional regulator [Candidatus Aenigmarchaeota archaeon]